MALKGSILRYTPPGVPDTAEVLVTPSGNCVAGGDTMSINPKDWTDPNGVGLLGEPLSVPTSPPTVEVNNLGGAYAQWIVGSSLTNGKIQFFAAGGADFGSNPYSAGILAGQIILRVPLR